MEVGVKMFIFPKTGAFCKYFIVGLAHPESGRLCQADLKGYIGQVDAIGLAC